MSIARSSPSVPVVLLAYLLFSMSANGQEQTPLRPLEPSDTSSPVAALNSLIDSCNELGN